MMRLVITRDYKHSSELAAEQIMNVIREKPDCLVGLATGSTPIGVYNCISEAYRQKRVDLSRIRIINLDEYVGLPQEDQNSYFYFMKKHLLDPCNIPADRIYIPDGTKPANAEIERMNAFMDEHSVDVQLLSVGTNGHIGFNEPDDVFFDRYHEVVLAESTRRSNSRFFSSMDEVPERAITMGIGGIMRARKIVFLATGDAKLEAMKAILEEGDVTPRVPGTILKFHCDCTIYLDNDLAKGIKPAKYIDVIKA